MGGQCSSREQSESVDHWDHHGWSGGDGVPLRVIRQRTDWIRRNSIFWIRMKEVWRKKKHYNGSCIAISPLDEVNMLRIFLNLLKQKQNLQCLIAPIICSPCV